MVGGRTSTKEIGVAHKTNWGGVCVNPPRPSPTKCDKQEMQQKYIWRDRSNAKGVMGTGGSGLQGDGARVEVDQATGGQLGRYDTN
jgi:hypothetical protein